MSFLQSLKPNPKIFVGDSVAGFSTGLFSIPEGMAYAQLAGVQPTMMKELDKTGTADIVGKENVFPAEPGLGSSVDKLREAAAKWPASSKDDSSGEAEDKDETE